MGDCLPSRRASTEMSRAVYRRLSIIIDVSLMSIRDNWRESGMSWAHNQTAMNSLLTDPTDQQERLLDVVYRGREQAGWPNFEEEREGRMHRVGRPGDWPIFQYVESVLYREHGLDATTVLLECPSVRFGAGPGSYGWLSFQKHDPRALAPDDKLALSIAGMARLPRARLEVEIFLDVLALLFQEEHSFAPSPTSVQTVEVTSGDVRLALGAPSGRWNLGPAELASVRAMLEHEPSTWQCRFDSTADGWTAAVSPFVRRYADVRTPDAYVDLVVDTLSPPPAIIAGPYSSSLSLVEAIDYLNAVWRVHAGSTLFRVVRAEAAAKLALDCETADEFDGRMSALCGVLDQLRLPNSSNHKLGDLKIYLRQALSPEESGRAEVAVEDLQAFFQLRAWRQHHGADERGRQGMRRLGIELPTTDWQATWQYLRTRAVAALSVLREEIESVDEIPLTSEQVVD
jgi:hypothetical protein